MGAVKVAEGMSFCIDIESSLQRLLHELEIWAHTFISS
jgi:hypothetical protein